MTDGAQPYTARPALLREPGDRIPAWACACPVKPGKRHGNPWECLGEDLAIAYWLAVPDTTYRVVKMLAWLRTEFAR